MNTLWGVGWGDRVTLGRAAPLVVSDGMPVLPAPPGRLRFSAAPRRTADKPEIVLIAEDYQTARLAAETLTWGVVVGIVAGTAVSSPTLDVPTVAETTVPLDQIREDDLLMVDAVRGVVFVNPELPALAQYHAREEAIAEQKRILLDATDHPARTRDGRTVHTFAHLTDSTSLEDLSDVGADGFYISAPSPLWHSLPDPHSVHLNLELLIDRVPQGKPLLLDVGSGMAQEAVLQEAILQEAAGADITVLLPAAGPDDLTRFGTWTDANRAVAERLTGEMLPWLTPRLGARLRLADTSPTPIDPDALLAELEARGVTRILGFLETRRLRSLLAALESWVAAAAPHLLPVYLFPHAEEFAAEEGPQPGHLLRLPLLVGSGAMGLVVPPVQVQIVKTRIRRLDFATCRQTLLRHLPRA